LPRSVIFAAAMLMCIAGVGMAAGGVFGVMVILVFAALGYVMASFGYPLVIVIIAFFLGPRLEVSIAQSLALSGGDPAALLDHPVAIGLLLLSVVSAVYLARRTRLAAG
jgi:putative tricarboxylic transport membrane protein